jgi:hypothetical protein
MIITLEEKLKCLKRELALRKAVYPKWVEQKRMKPHAAEHEIAVMEAIVADYVLLISPKQTPD